MGKRADFTVNFLRPGGSDIVVVNGDADLIAQAVRAAPGRVRQVLQADPAQVLGRLAAAATRPAGPADWSDQVGSALASRRLTGAEPGFVRGLRSINDWLARQPNPLVVIDGGEFGQWSQAFVQAPRRVINGVSGAIGGGIAYAIGASLADPGAQVLLLMGDGTSGFHLGEFDTAVRAGAAFTTVIGNDSCWNAERQIQIRDYGEERQIGCMLNPLTRYDQAVVALGGTVRWSRPTINWARRSMPRTPRACRPASTGGSTGRRRRFLPPRARRAPDTEDNGKRTRWTRQRQTTRRAARRPLPRVDSCRYGSGAGVASRAHSSSTRCRPATTRRCWMS
ncbi:MAG: thiamine pyrophosphate-dependent enzyme [Burkholderiaceae bacterium]